MACPSRQSGRSATLLLAIPASNLQLDQAGSCTPCKPVVNRYNPVVNHCNISVAQLGLLLPRCRPRRRDPKSGSCSCQSLNSGCAHLFQTLHPTASTP